MSAIKKKFELRLTPEQLAKVKAEFEGCGPACMLCMNPRMAHADIIVIVADEELCNDIKRMIELNTKARP